MTTSEDEDTEKESLRETISAYIDVGVITGMLICAGVLISGPPQLAGIALHTGNALKRIANFRRKWKGKAPL